jgi:hypothetical protein
MQTLLIHVLRFANDLPPEDPTTRLILSVLLAELQEGVCHKSSDL